MWAQSSSNRLKLGWFIVLSLVLDTMIFCLHINCLFTPILMQKGKFNALFSACILFNEWNAVQSHKSARFSFSYPSSFSLPCVALSSVSLFMFLSISSRLFICNSPSPLGYSLNAIPWMLRDRKKKIQKRERVNILRDMVSERRRENAWMGESIRARTDTLPPLIDYFFPSSLACFILFPSHSCVIRFRILRILNYAMKVWTGTWKKSFRTITRAWNLFVVCLKIISQT